MSGVFRVGGDAYDNFMGRYSRALAPLFADFAGVRAGDRVLDVGAGTGALTRSSSAAALAAAVDPSPGVRRGAARAVPERDVPQAPAEQLPFEDARSTSRSRSSSCVHGRCAGGVARDGARRAGSVAVCMWDIAEDGDVRGGRRTCGTESA